MSWEFLREVDVSQEWDILYMYIWEFFNIYMGIPYIYGNFLC